MKTDNRYQIVFLILFGILLCLAYAGQYQRGSPVYILGILTICIPVLDVVAILVIPRWRRDCSDRPYAHLAIVHVQTLVFWWATGVAGFFLSFPPYSPWPGSIEVICRVMADLSLFGIQVACILCHFAVVRWACQHPLPIPVLPVISIICPLLALLALLAFTTCFYLPV
jgi:hypothetical protein